MNKTELNPGFRIGEFVIDKKIGEGSFAIVYRAKHVVSNSAVCIKALPKEVISTPIAKTRLRREISLLKRMKHPFIAQFFQLLEDDDYFYIVMEYVTNGNLLEYVNCVGKLSEEQARKYFTQMIIALEYLHNEQKIAHRDIKCENILLDRNNNIRIIDFGLSNMFSEDNPKLKTACGSPAYVAPEMIEGREYTQTTDIWATGILLYAIVVGYLPFDDNVIQRLLQKIVYTDVDYPSFLSPQLVDLLQKMICKDPNKRITIEKIKEHPWFSKSIYTPMMDAIKMYVSNNVYDNNMHQGVDNFIDKEIVDKIASYGMDVHQLHNELLTNSNTDLTVLYQIFLREKVIKNIGNLVTSHQNMVRFQSSVLINTKQKTPEPEQKVPFVRRPVIARAAIASPSPQPGVLKPARLGAPQSVNSRRLSRPVAVMRNIPVLPKKNFVDYNFI
ncbi:CAMK family protein kinase [Histomonas meleagridis]|uniref:CAMK family protein kinase n=1 Tax=Histomonas meleagridis TaxID=135588 RepID=UPI003559B450|nr:CAMK family protein kinase [Histomonas meleagridis]KAH0805069.1 CAMK family protein kinase [Histomonas meleagridis]